MLNQTEPLEILGMPLYGPYSLEEWNAIYEALIGLLDHLEVRIWNSALDKLIHALEIEESQYLNSDHNLPNPIEQRLRSIFQVIVSKTVNHPEIFSNFCHRLKYLAEKSPYNCLIPEWLNQLAILEGLQAPAPDEIFAAQIFFGAYDSTWDKVGTTLLELLDHSNLNVRACAACQIGKFCSKALYEQEELWEWDYDEEKYDQQIAVTISPFDLTQLIRNREIERPGVAGAFWSSGPRADLDDFDDKEWLLDILEKSPALEPAIPYFPCNLEFYAHERFSRDADAIRRLMEMGRPWLALETATDESCKIADLEPILIELGNYDDPGMTRVASWQLAYHYHYLHPLGAKLGYVELQSGLPEIDLFLLFRQEEGSEFPDAVVIYPKAPNQELGFDIAQKWIDRIFPISVRGAPREDYWTRLLPCWYYQGGYIDYYKYVPDPSTGLLRKSWDYTPSNPKNHPESIDYVIIEYRSNISWNPKQFL